MNLHKKRLVRTPYSEQFALFDLDRTDENLNPASIGKLDLHYTADGTYGTLLVWKEVADMLDERRLDRLVDTILIDISTTMGIHPEYALEVFTPALSDYTLHSNMQESEVEGFYDEEDEEEELLDEPEQRDTEIV